MKNIILISFITTFIFSCQSKNAKSNVSFSDSQRDSLLTNIITYIYIPAPKATQQTKFEPQFRDFYVKNSSKFTLKNLEKSPDGWYYFLVIRPVAGGKMFKRGVLGKFKLKENSVMPTEFEEVANTPHLKEGIVQERSNYLFQELVKNGNLNAQMPMKQYIEWPDEHLAYDKKNNEWKVVKPY
ncbi:MAG: hypothetical protein U5N85_12400 [Arcicella sp.]|nr:hypothetical protein [Arcicella sp.]